MFAQLRTFVVVSGLPGAGKSTVARRIAPALDLFILDKDVILEQLFESEGAGAQDRRRELSRRSDTLLRNQAEASGGAVLVSHWHLPGMLADSGTPLGWLLEMPSRIAHVHCVCEPGLAAQRFAARQRHPGHLDQSRSFPEILASIQEMARLGPPDIGHRIDVDTTGEYDVENLIARIRQFVNTAPTS